MLMLCGQAQRRPATTCTGIFDDIDAPHMQKAYGAQWPRGCNGRALQTPFTNRWGDVQLSVRLFCGNMTGKLMNRQELDHRCDLGALL